MNYKALYNALLLLTLDYRIPLEVLKEKTGLDELEILQLVEDTGAKHYRLLGFLPPSELVENKTVRHFYLALEEVGLGEFLDITEERKQLGFAPNSDAATYCLNVPCYGKDWYAWHPSVLDLLPLD